MNPRLAKYTWFTLLYMLAVVAWGGFTRASFSGDGCGEHWPLCDGQVLPVLASTERLIEFSHRISSAIAGFMVIALVIWVRMTFARGTQARRAAHLTLFFTITEGLVGAFLVVFGLVADHDSISRTISMSVHMVNTFFLLGSLTMTGLFVTGLQTVRWRGQGAVGWGLMVAFGSVMLLAISGACSALGHMLKPTENVVGTALEAGAHYLVRLQVLHPLIATSVGLYLILVAGMLNHLRPDSLVRRSILWMMSLYGVQVVVGVASIFLKAPVAMQVVHLVLADVFWILLVAVSAYSLRDGVERVEIASEQAAPASVRSTGRALVKQYVALTKPRVISLLLFTTLTAMFMAARGWPGGWLLLAVALGGYMSAGAANAINMVIDRDIDGTMKRTARRPTVTQDIPSRHALAFAGILACVSFGLLWGAANLLAAVLALAGLVFYVVVYTLMLKRRTWHNIVIGGAAGAFPPLVGWAAVTNDLPILAWFLFALVFVWTPVHFWALALLIKDDYAQAGVPMLPVVRGERATVVQILAYAVLTVAVSVLPLFHRAGAVYIGTAILLNVVLMLRCMQLYRQIDRPHAVSLYKYSMLYLAVLFLMFAVDRAVTG